jgi:hypothetical protein
LNQEDFLHKKVNNQNQQEESQNRAENRKRSTPSRTSSNSEELTYSRRKGKHEQSYENKVYREKKDKSWKETRSSSSNNQATNSNWAKEESSSLTYVVQLIKKLDEKIDSIEQRVLNCS